MSSDIPLPLPVRLWAATGSPIPARLRDRVCHGLAKRLLRDERTYRGPHGLALRVDSHDKFQRAMLLGLFDPVVPALIDRYVPRGAHVLDCGSFIGYVALCFARAVGPEGTVHCFEPDPRVARRLRINIEANAMPWIRVNEVAVADSSTRHLDLALTDQLGWASVGVDVWKAPETVTVRSIAVDDYVEAEGIEPRFIKLDVEGAEANALRGMARTLAGASAPLLMEWIPWRIEANGDDPRALLEMLRGWGYSPHAPSLRGGQIELASGTGPGEDVLFLKDR